MKLRGIDMLVIGIVVLVFVALMARSPLFAGSAAAQPAQTSQPTTNGGMPGGTQPTAIVAGSVATSGSSNDGFPGGASPTAVPTKASENPAPSNPQANVKVDQTVNYHEVQIAKGNAPLAFGISTGSMTFIIEFNADRTTTRCYGVTMGGEMGSVSLTETPQNLCTPEVRGIQGALGRLYHDVNFALTQNATYPAAPQSTKAPEVAQTTTTTTTVADDKKPPEPPNPCAAGKAVPKGTSYWVWTWSGSWAQGSDQGLPRATTLSGLVRDNRCETMVGGSRGSSGRAYIQP